LGVVPGLFQLGRARTLLRGAVMTDLLDFVALSFLPRWYGLAVAERLRAGEPPGLVLSHFAARIVRDEPDKAAAVRRDAAEPLARAGAGEITPLPWNDSDYPVALTTIVDPPPVLWLRGQIGALAMPSVAIVGSRAASPYGLSVAEQLAGDLAQCGIAIVSGLARGVDSAAHRGALAAGGTTIAVLGSGVDVIYPSEHVPLAGEIEKDGAVISELAPGTPPLPMFFPRRNRIISGLSRAVVVIEAGDKSGSLITARCALDQGRDVLAVPGNVLSGRNRGAHGLLRDGAKIVESADDILEELGMSRHTGSALAAAHGNADAGATPRPADPVLACLPAGEPCDLDAISDASGLNSARLLPRLFELELQGLVRRVGGGRFLRIDRTC
jgi:DNA processing protein